MTLPQLSDNRIPRFDLIKGKMKESDPTADARSAIYRALGSGNRVWLVGYIVRPLELNLPLSLTAPPDLPSGWNYEAYVALWSMQIGAFLEKHAVETKVVLSPASGVNEEENLPLAVMQGWRD